MTLKEAINKYGKKKGLYFLYYFDPITNEHYYKLGYSKDITSRFKSYPLTVSVIHFFEGEYYDKPCHSQLKKWGFKFSRGVVVMDDTEWMLARDSKRDDEEHLKWATEAINVVYNEHEDYRLLNLPTFTLDSLQEKVKKETLEDYINGSNRHLIHAETGSGKTLIAYNVAIELFNSSPGNKSIIALTWKPAVLQEFEKYINGNDNGYLPHKNIKSNFVYTDDPKQALKYLNDETLGKHIVIGVSAYKLMAEKRSNGEKKSWKEVFSYKHQLLIGDEVHYGASGPSFLSDLTDEEDVEINDSKFELKINFDRILALSATPFPNMAYSDYYRGHISTITYVEQCELRDAVITGENTKSEDQRYKNLPTTRYFIKTVNSDVKEQSLKNGRTDFNIQSLFIDEKLKPYANQTIRGLRVAKPGDADLFGDEDHIVFDGTEKNDHVIIRTNRIKAASTLNELFTSDDFFDNYVKYNSVEKGYNKDQLESIVENNSKTMFITSGGLMTGTDIPKWNKLVYFSEPKSPMTLGQDVGRIKRIYPGKKFSDVVFNSPDLEITLDYIAKSWCAIKPEEETNET